MLKLVSNFDRLAFCCLACMLSLAMIDNNDANSSLTSALLVSTILLYENSKKPGKNERALMIKNYRCAIKNNTNLKEELLFAVTVMVLYKAIVERAESIPAFTANNLNT